MDATDTNSRTILQYPQPSQDKDRGEASNSMTLQSLKQSLAQKVQQEELQTLASRLEAVQRHLASLKRKPLGDLLHSTPEGVEQTLESVEDMLDSLGEINDFKIKKQREVTDLVMLNRSLENRLDNAKLASAEEISYLKEKVKALTQEKLEKNRMFMQQKSLLESEKSTYENKTKYLQNEVRKKDLTIKNLSDKLAGHGSKQVSKLNQSSFIVELGAEASRSGRDLNSGANSNSVLAGLNQSTIFQDEKWFTFNPTIKQLREESN